MSLVHGSVWSTKYSSLGRNVVREGEIRNTLKSQRAIVSGMEARCMITLEVILPSRGLTPAPPCGGEQPASVAVFQLSTQSVFLFIARCYMALY